ncbi:NADPH-dependent diflavin oxidoreductase ATR3 [Tetrabaena socialis]|uniref:NADPH-dependent diflavin oxidoreductase ATR3 n=1 Tax=Tetrabaena socialis TaxID=47790 RepID=A0A2J8A165_9CHLO|nr:NADPH-dependent diflavin oxidoreductase ATR3 [Tetrabaena socialis]|eukprot:PNH06259.1 NADPH-dependent diflavin oxidoreductase ATR3 [Tetrabaena socialis]
MLEALAYNQREGRTVAEALSDFRSASPPLEWLLEAAPPLRPRLFSAASSQRLRGPSVVQVLVALVRYSTPYKRPKVGLCSAYLASLDPEAAAAAGEEVRVAVWTERGCLRMPKSLATPLILVGPGTGVAPFRSFLEERYSIVAPHEAQLLQLQQQQQQQQLQRGHLLPHGAAGDGGAQGPQPSSGAEAAADLAAPAAQPPQQADAGGGGAAAAAGVAPCYLFFGCRGRTDDFYYRAQWEEYARAGVLHPRHGLITAFSREDAQQQAQQAQQAQEQEGGQEQGQAAGAADALPVPASAAAGAAATAGAALDGVVSAAAGGGGAPTAGGGRVYVTHRIREQGELLWELLSGGAVVYVSGSAQKMPAGVAAAFADVVARYGGMDKEAAVQYVRQLELKGRYHVEAWS